MSLAETRESYLRNAASMALDVRDLLARAYEPAALPVGLALAVEELQREIWRARVVNGTLPEAEAAARRIRDSDAKGAPKA